MTVTGVDVSHHQGLIDWRPVASAGHRFAFLKATEGTSFTDKRYRANLAAASDAGLLAGAYHFARPDSTSPQASAELHLRFAGTNLAGRLPHVLDLEAGSGDLTNWALAWLTHVEAATGKPPILYTYAAFGPSHLKNDRRLARHPLWIAAYRPDPPKAFGAWAQTGWAFWQHTSTGRVSGIGGNVDLNRFAGDPAALAALAITPLSPPTEDDMPAPTDVIARIVLPENHGGLDAKAHIDLRADGTPGYHGATPDVIACGDYTRLKPEWQQGGPRYFTDGWLGDDQRQVYPGGPYWSALANDGNVYQFGPGTKALLAA